MEGLGRLIEKLICSCLHAEVHHNYHQYFTVMSKKLNWKLFIVKPGAELNKNIFTQLGYTLEKRAASLKRKKGTFFFIFKGHILFMLLLWWCVKCLKQGLPMLLD